MQIILHLPGSDSTVTVPEEQRPLYPGWTFVGPAPEPAKSKRKYKE